MTVRARGGIATGALRSCVGLCLALGGACRNDIPATEIVVTIDTTFGVPCTIDGLRIDAVGDGETSSREISLFDHTLPGTIPLTPLTHARHAMVTVTALRNGDVFATATGSTDFEDESSRELHFLLDRNCIAAPCQATGVGRFVDAPAPPPRRGCGEDGYAWRDAFLAMRDACTMREAIMGTLLVDVDEDEQMIPVMPFPFWFYNELVTQVWVGDNGYIGLGNAKPDALIKKIGAPRSLGEPGFPGRGALAFWDDLRTSTAGVCYAVSGAFPDRILWITWKDACFATDTGERCGPANLGRLTFGMALEETTNRVYMGYRNMTATMANADRAKGGGATIGISNAAPRACKSDLCSPEGTCQDGGACGYTEFSPGKILPSFPTLEFDPL